MKNNLYTKSMHNIRAPQDLVDNAINEMNAENTDIEVIAAKNQKRIVWKFTGVVAAMLALIIGFSVIPFGDNKDAVESNNQHSFILKAGAAEITPQMYVEVGEYYYYGGSEKFYPHNQEDPYDTTGERSIISLMEVFQIENLMCYGDNIDSITYTAHNCKLAYKDDFYGLLDAKDVPQDETEEGVNVYFDRYLWASSCTYDFNSQKETIYDEIDKTYVDFYIPLKIAFTLNFEKGEHVVTLSETGFVDTAPIYEQEFNAREGEFLLDVTANFKDGAKVTKTLQFKCENDNGLLLMYAKEV